MKRHLKYPPLALMALMALMFAGCDNKVVPRTDYEELLAEYTALEACNDSLEFQLQDLKLYNSHLEETVDSLQKVTVGK